PAPTGVQPSALLVLSGGTIFYGDLSDRLYQTTDNGADWNLVFHDSMGSAVYNVVQSPANGHLFLRTNYGNLFRSIDSGSSWQWVSTDTIGGSIYATAIDASGTIFVGTDFEGMLRSTDDGVTFDLVDSMLTASFVYDVAVDRTSNVYGVTEDLIYRSTDRGETWSKLNIEIGESLFDPAFAIDSANVLYMGNNAGVWVSNSAGLTWKHPVGPPQQQASNQCYQIAVSSAGSALAATQYGIVRSTDHGISWALDTLGIGLSTMKGIVIGKDGNLYSEDGVGTIYRSSDDGELWAPFLSNSSGLTAIETDGTMFRTSRPAVFRSTDQGLSWQQIWIPDSVHPRSVNRTYLDSHSALFAATDSGIYRSSDHGNSWTSASDGLQDPSASRLSAATDLCEDARDGTYYAASRGQGVFRSVVSSSVSNSLLAPALEIRNSPNPFKDVTIVSFLLRESSEVRLELRNTVGTLLWSQEFHELSAGEHRVPIVPSHLPDGNYLCTVRTSEGSATVWIDKLN